MKIEINLTDDTLRDYLLCEGDEITFTDVFKGEIKDSIISRINWANEIRNLIKEHLNSELSNKIGQYKHEESIRQIVAEVIKEEMEPRRSGSFFLGDSYKQQVAETVRKTLKSYTWDIEEITKRCLRDEIKTVLDETLENHPFREFIDVAKLTAHVQQILSERYPQ